MNHLHLVQFLLSTKFYVDLSKCTDDAMYLMNTKSFKKIPICEKFGKYIHNLLVFSHVLSEIPQFGIFPDKNADKECTKIFC